MCGWGLRWWVEVFVHRNLKIIYVLVESGHAILKKVRRAGPWHHTGPEALCQKTEFLSGGSKGGSMIMWKRQGFRGGVVVQRRVFEDRLHCWGGCG